VNYRALHLGQEIQQATQELKQKCKSVRKSVRKSPKAAITKQAPGAFSPKPASPAIASFISCYYFFFILEILALKMNGANAVPDPEPSLLNSNFVKPNNLQLLFRPSGKYAASTHFIHIRVPFNF
jgi:hypothetical protein